MPRNSGKSPVVGKQVAEFDEKPGGFEVERPFFEIQG